MRDWHRKVSPFLLIMIGLLAGACVGTQPLVFPAQGQLGPTNPAVGEEWGTTVAIAIDSNWNQAQDKYEFYDLDESRVEVWLSDNDPDEIGRAHV